MDIYDVVVVGAGPAGIMAAVRAGQLKKRVVLIERNNAIGRKILITGKGRCNITNTADADAFMEKFGKQGAFLRSAFGAFFNQDLMDFFESKGLSLKAERQGRVFPVTDKAESVVEVLKKCFSENNVRILYNTRVLDIKKKEGFLRLSFENGGLLDGKKVILAAGGASYKATGSSGEGFDMARKLGHTITPLLPALVPLKTAEPWVKRVQGLALKNISLTFVYDKKKISSEIGELMFTHFGVSGPLVLDLSGEVVSLLKEYKKMSLFIDLKPALTFEQVDKRLLREFEGNPNLHLKNLLKELLPHNLIPVFMELLGMNPLKTVNQITKTERQAAAKLLKALPLTVTGSLNIEEAMVTAGGISTKEINPKTLESKIVPALYFAGEIIEGYAPSGGYNLQQAFSTGYLAGEKAALA